MSGTLHQEWSTEDALLDRWAMFFRACDPGDLAADDFEEGKIVQMPPKDRRLPIPDSDRRGIYYYLNGRDQVLYVGVATEAFGTRFWDHIQKIDADPSGDGWGAATRFVPILLKKDVSPEKLVQLAALEAFLIAMLRPPLNTALGGVAVHTGSRS